MEYRYYKNNLKSSLFGLGTMRLPLVEGTENIDEAEAIKMIRYAIDNGVNYIDTAYPYHGGASEPLVGKALKDGYRERTLLATKMPSWLVKTKDDFEKYFNEQLEKLQTDYLDFYLLHALNREYWENYKKLDVFPYLENLKKQGKIKNICFSFHDELDLFKEIVDYYDWDMCQIQFNVLDTNYQAGLEGLLYAGKKGIPVVIMEPLKGGFLSMQVPDDIGYLYKNYKKTYSPTEWAFRYVANFPEVVTVLSGSSNIDQLKDSINIFSDIKPNCLTEDDLALIKKVRDSYNEKVQVNCTACNYCMPCPQDVSIPKIFSAYNRAFMFYKDAGFEGFEGYKELMGADKDGSKCVECGACESACPQHIKIIDELKKADLYFRG